MCAGYFLTCEIVVDSTMKVFLSLIAFVFSHFIGCQVHPSLDSIELPDVILSNNNKTRSHLHRAFNVLHSGRCKHIYFDFGTNLGVQIRKLYEPHLYPGAPVLPIFDARFGKKDDANRKDVCAFGFEPNPHWTDTLEQIEESYNLQGWPVVMFTETAINTHGDDVSFFLEPAESSKHHEWGASLTAWHKSMSAITAGSIHVSHFIHFVANKREGRVEGSQIIAKMDVEGAEYALVPHLIITGALCLINEIFVEFHDFSVTGELPPTGRDSFIADIKYLLKNSGDCNNTAMNYLDDETYGDTWMPLPGNSTWHK